MEKMKDEVSVVGGNVAVGARRKTTYLEKRRVKARRELGGGDPDSSAETFPLAQGDCLILVKCDGAPQHDDLFL